MAVRPRRRARVAAWGTGAFSVPFSGLPPARTHFRAGAHVTLPFSGACCNAVPQPRRAIPHLPAHKNKRTSR